MGRKKLSMSEKIRRYAQAHPSAKPRDIAQALGVKVSLVYAVRYHKEPPAPAHATTAITVPRIELVEAPADVVNHPPHYTDGGIETIDFIKAKLTREEFIGYLKGNALKYASRVGKKDDPAVDAGKMAWYTAKLVATLTAAPR